MSDNRPPRERGFTLIEMLIALAIFATLVTVLLSGYMQGLSLWERAQKKSAVWQQYQSRAAWIQQLSEQIVAADYRLDHGGYAAFFMGDVRGFKALSTSPVLSPAGKVIPVQLYLFSDQTSGVEKLMYREGRRGEDPERGMFLQKPNWIVLLDKIEKASFSYYVETGKASDPVPQYVMKWMRKTTRLPEQILFRFVDKNGHTHIWRFRCQSYSNAMPLVNVYGGG